MKKTKSSDRPSIYQTVTDRIVNSLKAGVIPWEKPWKTPRFACGPFPRNFFTGKSYRGMNVMLLWSSDYRSPFWLTFKQAQVLKGHVRKGEAGTPIIFDKQLPEDKKKQAAKDEDEDEGAPFFSAITPCLTWSSATISRSRRSTSRRTRQSWAKTNSAKAS